MKRGNRERSTLSLAKVSLVAEFEVEFDVLRIGDGLPMLGSDWIFEG